MAHSAEGFLEQAEPMGDVIRRVDIQRRAVAARQCFQAYAIAVERGSRSGVLKGTGGNCGLLKAFS